MGSTKVVAPVAAADGDDAELGDDDRRTDGGGNLLRGLDAETDVALGVTNDDDGLEPGALTGTGLLLDGLDLYAWKKSLGQPSVSTIQFRRRGPDLSRIWPLARRGSSQDSRTFMTSSLSLGRKLSTIWYSLMGSEWR